MKITRDQLKGWGACRDGYEWFLRRFPDGEAEYQDVLNALAEDDLRGPAAQPSMEVHMREPPRLLIRGLPLELTDRLLRRGLSATDGLEQPERVPTIHPRCPSRTGPRAKSSSCTRSALTTATDPRAQGLFPLSRPARETILSTERAV